VFPVGFFGVMIVGLKEVRNGADISPEFFDFTEGDGAFFKIGAVEVGDIGIWFFGDNGFNMIEGSVVIEENAGDSESRAGVFRFFVDFCDAFVFNADDPISCGIRNWFDKELSAGFKVLDVFSESLVGNVIGHNNKERLFGGEVTGKIKGVKNAFLWFVIGIFKFFDTKLCAVSEIAEKIADIGSSGDKDNFINATSD